MQNLIEEILFSNIIDEVAVFLIFLLVSFSVFIASRYLKNYALKKVATKDTSLDNIVRVIFSRIKNQFIFVISFLYPLSLFYTNDSVTDLTSLLIPILAFMQTAYVLDGLSNLIIDKKNNLNLIDKDQVKNAVSLIHFVSKSIIWSIATLLCIDNLGIDITALIAGLGIGGIAIALAAQNILGDLFASLAIVLDKPFVIGDYIVVDDVKGTVEHIGIKTTRIRGLSGQELICSNADLLSSRVSNYKRMKERRILFTIGIIYETKHETLLKIPKMLEEIITDIKNAKFDRAHFINFGDSSLDFEIVYYVQIPDYEEYMNIQQEINLAIFNKFEAMNIGFAYPTRTLHITNQ